MAENSLWFLLTGLTTLLSSQVVFWTSVAMNLEASQTPVWILIMGALAMFWVELGGYFVADYYGFKENRLQDVKPPFLSRDLDPPQLALKAGGAFYLISFLFVVILLFALFEEGWFLLLLSLLGFAVIHLWGTPPVMLRKRKFWCNWSRSFASTIVPAMGASFLLGVLPERSLWIFYTIVFVALGLLLKALLRFWSR